MSIQNHMSAIVFVTLLAVNAASSQAAPPIGSARLEVLPFAMAETQDDPSALRIVAVDGVGAALSTADWVLLKDFPIARGINVDLDLHRLEIFTPDAKVVRGTAMGDVPIARPEVQLFSGRVVGHAGSSAFISLAPSGIQGWLSLGGEDFILSNGPNGAADDIVVFSPRRLPPSRRSASSFTCDAEKLRLPGRVLNVDRQGTPAPRGTQAGPSACRAATLAIETDYEFTGWLFGGDLGASGAYAATLIGAVSEVFMRDFNASLSISYLRLWDADVDPWDQGSTLDQLFQFQNYWNANMTGESRSVVHFLSGRGLGGGVAYLPGLCYPQYDYGLSANLSGYFPYPIENNSWANWDLMVVAHELGHNFGAPHTHDMNPLIDGCGLGDCSITPNGTIMSYCHLCANGLADVRMEMHTRTVYEAILPTLDTLTFCDIVEPCDPVGDCNGDGTLDMADVDCFVEVALGQSPFNGPLQRCDLINDGVVNGTDAGPFVEAVLGM